MRIGIRKSPHLELLAASIEAAGDTFTSTNDTGADFYLAWGWPQAEQVSRDNGGRNERIMCMDAHPFALQKGDKTGARILQLGNWGALARYPDWLGVATPMRDRSTPGGAVLVLGQVYTAIQGQGGLVDVWHTGGYERWLEGELALPKRIYRKHPRVWAAENDGAEQPSLESDLWACERAVSWNSTAAIHSRLLGYPASAHEAHGWAHMSLEHLAGLVLLPDDIKSGRAWARYREWLKGAV